MLSLLLALLLQDAPPIAPPVRTKEPAPVAPAVAPAATGELALACQKSASAGSYAFKVSTATEGGFRGPGDGSGEGGSAEADGVTPKRAARADRKAAGVVTSVEVRSDAPAHLSRGALDVWRDRGLVAYRRAKSPVERFDAGNFDRGTPRRDRKESGGDEANTPPPPPSSPAGGMLGGGIPMGQAGRWAQFRGIAEMATLPLPHEFLADVAYHLTAVAREEAAGVVVWRGTLPADIVGHFAGSDDFKRMMREFGTPASDGPKATGTMALTLGAEGRIVRIVVEATLDSPGRGSSKRTTTYELDGFDATDYAVTPDVLAILRPR